MNRSELTEIRLKEALQRLLDGKPINTPCDGRINLKRINDEAKLSSGGIYYYKDFITKARSIIDKDISNNKQYLNSSNAEEKISKLRKQRDKEKQLKVIYREQRDKMKQFADSVVEENARLSFAIHEAYTKINELEQQILQNKLVPIHKPD